MRSMRSAIGYGTVLLMTAGALACEGSADRPPGGPPPPAASTPAPIATRQISGIVVDTNDGPVAGARVTHAASQTASGADGRFSFAVRNVAPHFVEVAAPGFEEGSWGWSVGDAPVDLRIILASRVFYSSAAPLTASLSANDLPYYVGEAYDSPYCRPCRLVRMASDVEPSAAIHLRWSGAGILGLWASDGTTVIVAEEVGPRHLRVATVGTGEDRRVYVGGPWGAASPAPVVFTLSRD
jgi:hypothetical protein